MKNLKGLLIRTLVLFKSCNISFLMCNFLLLGGIIGTQVGATECFVPTNKFPPNGKYTSPQGSMVTYVAVGITFQKMVFREIPHVDSPPALGADRTFNFSAKVDLKISYDGMVSWSHISAPASIAVKLTHSYDTGGIEHYDTEMLMLNISGGGLPGTYMIRESPTLASVSTTTIRPVAGGYQIDSFFDIFTEISIDGGQSWIPGNSAISTELSYPADYFVASKKYPPNGKYISGREEEARSFGPIVAMKDMIIRDLSHVDTLPPLLGNKAYLCDAVVDLQLSTDGGNVWRYIHSPASLVVQLTHTDNDGVASFFDRELVQLDIAGGNLPVGARLRESPTRASTGKLNVAESGGGGGGGGGYKISSFFDIFLEISLDGGATWTPANNYIPLHLIYPPEYDFSTPNFPPLEGSYINRDTVVWSNGVIMRKLEKKEFLQSFPPPPPGSSTAFSFDDNEYFQLSTDAGVNWSDVHAISVTTVRLSSADDDGSARFFNTEITQMDIAGGGLPAGWMIRESPTLASIGRHNIRAGTSYPASSFFDVFTEISLDGGMSWSPSFTYMTLELFVCPAITISPSELSDGTLWGSYDQTISASGGASPYTYSLRSGALPTGLELSSKGEISGTPVNPGTYSFQVEAKDLNNCTATMTYSVNINPPEYFFTNNIFPPENSKFVSHQPGDTILWQNGVMMRSVIHSGFTGSVVLPPPQSGPLVHSFGGNIYFQMSFDAGVTWSNFTAPTTDMVQMSWLKLVGSTDYYTLLLLQLNVSGGGLPPGVMLRTSPLLPSPGTITCRPVPVGYYISSFFDVFFDISLDGGLTWYMSATALPMYLAPLVQAISMPVSQGWNMRSVPMAVDDYRKIACFPDAISEAFEYKKSYIAKDTLENGVGYWIKYSEDSTLTFTGVPIQYDTFPVSPGWNMIGSISQPVSILSIVSIPPSMVTSPFFGYSGVYFKSDSIHPGYAYWVKVDQSGGLVLSATGMADPASCIRIVPTSETPPSPPLDASIRKELPAEYVLEQAFPSPFNPSTTIRYQLPEESKVTLKVYSLLGQNVATLVNERQPAGYQRIQWNAGSLVSGIYYYRLEAVSTVDPDKTFTQVRKVILLK